MSRVMDSVAPHSATTTSDHAIVGSLQLSEAVAVPSAATLVSVRQARPSASAGQMTDGGRCIRDRDGLLTLACVPAIVSGKECTRDCVFVRTCAGESRFVQRNRCVAVASVRCRGHFDRWNAVTFNSDIRGYADKRGGDRIIDCDNLVAVCHIATRIRRSKCSGDGFRGPAFGNNSIGPRDYCFAAVVRGRWQFLLLLSMCRRGHSRPVASIGHTIDRSYSVGHRDDLCGLRRIATCIRGIERACDRVVVSGDAPSAMTSSTVTTGEASQSSVAVGSTTAGDSIAPNGHVARGRR